MFNEDCYVKIVDTTGNFRFGFIEASKDHGSLLIVDLTEEGLSKINWDEEYARNTGKEIVIKDFNVLLTDIEKKIINLLAACQNTQQIAQAMKIAPVTVRAHVRDLKIKLQLTTREQLVAYAQGIVKKI